MLPIVWSEACQLGVLVGLSRRWRASERDRAIEGGLPCSCGGWAEGTDEEEGQMDVKVIADLLHEAAETHHRVYRIVDGRTRTGRPGMPTG